MRRLGDRINQPGLLPMARKIIAATGKRQYTATQEVIMLEVIVFFILTQVWEGTAYGPYVTKDGVTTSQTLEDLRGGE